MPRKQQKAGRSRNGSGSIDRVQDRELWRIRYTVFDPLSGKGKRKAEYFRDEAEAHKALALRTAAVATDSYQEPERRTLAAWLKVYFDEFATGIQPETMGTYEKYLRNHVLPALGSVPLADLNREKMQRFVNALAASGIAPSSIRTILAPVSKALHCARRFGYLRENPADDLVYPAVPKTEKPALTDAQAAELERVTMDTPIGNMIFLARCTGLRRREILGLAWPNIHLSEKYLTVYQLSDENALKLPKNRKTRRIPLTDEVLDRFRAIQRQQRKMKLAAGSAWQNDLDLVFTDEAGRPRTTGYVDFHFREARKAAGLDDSITFHSLRRTFATDLDRLGVSDKAYTSILGHATAAFTREKYQRYTDDLERETLQKLQSRKSS